MTVSPQNNGPSGQHVAADAAAFVLNPNRAPLGGYTAADEIRSTVGC